MHASEVAVDDQLNPSREAVWPAPVAVLFRFAFLYFLLYTLTANQGFFPGSALIAGWMHKAWDATVPWLGAHVLHLPYPITIRPNGSGDTTYNYVQIFGIGALALIGTVIWSVLDRKRPNYRVLNEWLRVWLRYVLAFAMLLYGFAKIRPGQFYFPMPEQLLRPYGEVTPFVLVWTFMGYSYPYSLFAAAGEIVGGILLFFRRTTMIGALVVIGVMSNVAMLNYFYDVPVKLYSTHLLLMAVYLLIAERNRLFDFFVRDRAVPPSPARPPLQGPVGNRIRVAAGTLILLLAAVNSFGMLRNRLRYATRWETPPLAGAYDVELFARNRDTIPPLLTDTSRWQRVFISTRTNLGYPG